MQLDYLYCAICKDNNNVKMFVVLLQVVATQQLANVFGTLSLIGLLVKAVYACQGDAHRLITNR